MDNTTDMQSVSRTRPKTARNCAISHKTTGPSAAAPAGSVEREPRTARQEGRAGALGINAKLPAPPVNPMLRRVERFALQSVARDILPDSRTAKCLRIRAHAKDAGLEVQEPQDGQLWGLQTCGSVWVCPVCGAKVVERRRGEIQQAMAMHRACGGEVHLLTLTAPHTRFDVLEELQAKLGKALNGFLADKTVKNVFKDMGYIGQIRGYEVTMGARAQTTAGTRTFTFSSSSWSRGRCAAHGLENAALSAVGCLLSKGRPRLSIFPAWHRSAGR